MVCGRRLHEWKCLCKIVFRLHNSVDVFLFWTFAYTHKTRSQVGLWTYLHKRMEHHSPIYTLMRSKYTACCVQFPSLISKTLVFTYNYVEVFFVRLSLCSCPCAFCIFTSKQKSNSCTRDRNRDPMYVDQTCLPLRYVGIHSEKEYDNSLLYSYGTTALYIHES